MAVLSLANFAVDGNRHLPFSQNKCFQLNLFISTSRAFAPLQPVHDGATSWTIRLVASKVRIDAVSHRLRPGGAA
jgi:hypothetical protein